MTKEEIIRLNRMLIGKITPIGDTSIDEQIKGSLEVHIEVVDELIFYLEISAGFKNCSEKSMKEVGDKAFQYLKRLNNNIAEFLEEVK